MSALQTQHWNTRIPLRVYMLGLFFFTLLFGVLGLLSAQWQIPIGYYLCCSLLVLLSLVYQNMTQTQVCLGCNEQSDFYLLTPHPQSVQITQLWLSAWAVCVCVHVSDQPIRHQYLIFWRSSQSITAWRHLYIHLLRYQLQHSGSAAKATV